MTGHEDLERLAALAEGTLDAEAAEQARQHMAVCRSCMSAYADAVRYRAAWLAKPEAFATAVAERDDLPRAFRAVRAARRSAPVWFAAAAGLAILLAGSGWLTTRMPAWPGSVTLSPAVRAALSVSSSHGLVLPGGESLATGSKTEMRSGMAESTPDMEREVDSLIALYERGHAGPTLTLELVVSLMATGDLDAARDYAREGLRAFPKDVRLTVAYAGLLDRGDDLAGSEALLRSARRRAPGDPLVALDLAMVLRQRGEQTESRALLQSVSRCRIRALAERATRELAAAR